VEGGGGKPFRLFLIEAGGFRPKVKREELKKGEKAPPSPQIYERNVNEEEMVASVANAGRGATKQGVRGGKALNSKRARTGKDKEETRKWRRDFLAYKCRRHGEREMKERNSTKSLKGLGGQKFSKSFILVGGSGKKKKWGGERLTGRFWDLGHKGYAIKKIPDPAVKRGKGAEKIKEW